MRYVIVFIYLVVSIWLIQSFGCKPVPEIHTNDVLLLDVLGDAETVKSFSNNYISDDHEFGGAEMQSSKFAHSGQYSCEVNSTKEFGLSTAVEDVIIGSYVEVSVWRYSPSGKGALHISSSKVGDLYYLVGKPIVFDSNGWEKIVVNVPIMEEIDVLKVACYNPNDSSVFFDDLRIRVYKHRPVRHDLNSELSIQISDSNWNVLKKFRELALKQEVITDDLKKYVKAVVLYQGDSIPVKMRFKGDWTDHLIGDKWSFRIKVGKGFSINGLKSFSIQSPETRGFMNEWFMHKIFDLEGLLTTRYDFIPVSINGDNLGIYAIEEHFDKQLVESRKRREGPILKFDEEGFWEREMYAKSHNVYYNIPYYEAAAILPFKRNRTLKNPTLKSEFLIAQNQMFQYKNFKPSIENVMNLEALASYHALFDLGGVLHGQGWHNQRFYYNPITSSLEPIAYDLYTEQVQLVNRRPILGMVLENEKEIPVNTFLNQSVFNQRSFQEMYSNKLEIYSNSKYLKGIIKELENEIDSLNKILGAEFGGYEFNVIPFYEKAKGIQAQLPEFKAQIKSKTNLFKSLHEKYDSLEDKKVYYSQSGLKVYCQRRDSIQTDLQFINFHTGPLKLKGYSLGKSDSIIPFENMHELGGFSSSNEIKIVSVKGKVSNVYFTLPSYADSVLKKKVVPWPYPNVENPRRDLEYLPFQSPYYTAVNGNLVLNKRVKLKEVLFVPRQYKLIINPGTTIEFDKGGGILSYGPVHAMGTKKNKIAINGIHKDNHGFQVLTENDSSMFHYVDFVGMNTLRYKGWNLTGGVTVYQGKVDMDHCSFQRNYCEDAVNLVNSEFTMKNCLIYATYSDGFDGDFCKGLVDNVHVSNAGNDGLDFSGSVIQILHSDILIPGDKAISGGEASRLTIENCEIRGAKLGVVAKDNSTVSVTNSEFHFCTNPFAVYQKKDEYGPAFIKSSQNKWFETNQEFLIGPGSSINESGKIFNTVNLEDSSVLYQ